MSERKARPTTIQLEREAVPFFLRGVELFQGVSQKEGERISGLCAERRYVKGATIFTEGDATDALYIVKEGLVKLVSVSEKGTETILHILKADEVFGELFLAEGQRPFTAVTIEDVVLTVIPRENFLILLTSVPAVSLNFARLLSKRAIRGLKFHVFSRRRVNKSASGDALWQTSCTLADRLTALLGGLSSHDGGQRYHINLLLLARWHHDRRGSSASGPAGSAANAVPPASLICTLCGKKSRRINPLPDCPPESVSSGGILP